MFWLLLVAVCPLLTKADCLVISTSLCEKMSVHLLEALNQYKKCMEHRELRFSSFNDGDCPPPCMVKYFSMKCVVRVTSTKTDPIALLTWPTFEDVINKTVGNGGNCPMPFVLNKTDDSISEMKNLLQIFCTCIDCKLRKLFEEGGCLNVDKLRRIIEECFDETQNICPQTVIIQRLFVQAYLRFLTSHVNFDCCFDKPCSDTAVAPTTTPATTVAPTTTPATTVAPTTTPATTVAPTTTPATTVAPTTTPATTVGPTTTAATTVVPTTTPTTTVAPTTTPRTTVAPTTTPATTVAPTTTPGTTVAPTTTPSTTVAPTTTPATTVAPTTTPATTVAPTSTPATTVAPTTMQATTVASTSTPATTVVTTVVTTPEPCNQKHAGLCYQLGNGTVQFLQDYRGCILIEDGDYQTEKSVTCSATNAVYTFSSDCFALENNENSVSYYEKGERVFFKRMNATIAGAAGCPTDPAADVVSDRASSYIGILTGWFQYFCECMDIKVTDYYQINGDCDSPDFNQYSQDCYNEAMTKNVYKAFLPGVAAFNNLYDDYLFDNNFP